MSRKLSKIERKLQRKAMAALATRPQQPSAAADESVKTLEALGAWEPESVPTPPEEPSAPRRIQRVLETSAAELEQAEIEVLDELLAAAREGIALYKAEARARTEAQQAGQPITTRWQVAPGVFEKLTGRVLRIIEIKIRYRRTQRSRQAA